MPADDLVLNVRQIAGYPPAGSAAPSDALLIQRGGLGGPYLSLDAQALVSTALESGGPLGVGVAPPGAAYSDQILTGWYCGSGLAFNAYLDETPVWRALNPGASSFINLTTAYAFRFDVGGFVAAGAPVAPLTTAMSLTYDGELAVAGQVSVGRDPIAPNELVTVSYLGATLAASVRSFNGRFGNVMLNIDDIICAGGAPIFSPYFQGSPRASTPPPTSNSSRIATTAFVQMALAAHGDVTGYAPIDSPNFTGVPTAPTAALGASDGQIATTAFVQNAVTESTTGVASFNSRVGAVVLSLADVTAVGGAPINSPIFTGNPAAPTRLPGDSSGALATTAFVQEALTSLGSGVTSFNTRTGAVVLTSADVGAVGVSAFNGRTGSVNLIGNDVSAAGGALSASPAFTGTPTAPTASPGTNSTILATCAFVTAAIAAAAAAGVTSFNSRSGVVTLTAADLTGVGGALLASPAFSGVPSAPTAAPGANSTQLATCAFVTSAITAIGAGVTSFNSRAGAITLIANDISGAGGALLASPVFVGQPVAPTASPSISNQQIATTAYVTAAVSAAPYLPLSGGTLTGALVGTTFNASGNINAATLTASAVFSVNSSAQCTANAFIANVPSGIYGLTITGAAGTARAIVGETAGVRRWSLNVGDGGLEGGANAGSDFSLTSFNDAGNQLGAFQVQRASVVTSINAVGAMGWANTGAVGDATLMINKATAGTTQSRIFGLRNGVFRWQIALGDVAGETGSNAGSNFSIGAFSDAGGSTGNAAPLQITRSSSVCTFGVAIVNGPSDRSLKENIGPLEGALDKVLALQGVSFNMLSTPGKREIGLIAQDVEPVVPEVMQTYATSKMDENGELRAAEPKLALDYPKLTALLIEAIKTLTARVAALEGATT